MSRQKMSANTPSPSHPPSRRTITPTTHLIHLSIIFLAAVALLPQCTHAYVSYKVTRGTYKYPSIPSAHIGERITKDDRFDANLFQAPDENKHMCQEGNIRHRLNAVASRTNAVEEEDTIRRMEFVPSSDYSMKFLRKEDRRTNSGGALALLVQRGGGCSIEDKARNIMQLNDLYSTPAGKVEFMILVNDDLDNNISRNDDVVQKGLTIDIGVVYVDVDVGDDIWLRITERDDNDLPGMGRSFLSEKAFVPNTDGWSFDISIDGVYLMSDQTQRWITMIYIFLGFIVAIPMMRFISLLIMNRGCRWKRNETGRVVPVESK